MRAAWFLFPVIALGGFAFACGAGATLPEGPASREARDARDAGGEADDADLAEDASPEAQAAGEAETAAPASDGPCPAGMALVDGAFCIDRYEASVVAVAEDGTEEPHPHYLPVDGKRVRAVSEPGRYPQGYISETQAEGACAASGKRLCSHTEWKTACMGPSRTTYPYGDARRDRACHDRGKSAVVAVFGAKAVLASPVSPEIAFANSPARRQAQRAKEPTARGATAAKPPRRADEKKARPAHGSTKGRASKTVAARATRPEREPKGARPEKARKPASQKTLVSTTRARPRAAKKSEKPANVDFNVWTQLNDPRLGQVEGAVARTGDHAECTNDWGPVDMVGNLHEWVTTDGASPRGTFAGGYYLDTSLNGEGCNYRTQAHAHDYHDYSTGFRCCADLPSATEPSDP